MFAKYTTLTQEVARRDNTDWGFAMPPLEVSGCLARNMNWEAGDAHLRNVQGFALLLLCSLLCDLRKDRRFLLPRAKRQGHHG